MTLAFLALLGAPYIYDISSLRVKLPNLEVHSLTHKFNMNLRKSTRWWLCRPKDLIHFWQIHNFCERLSCDWPFFSSISAGENSELPLLHKTQTHTLQEMSDVMDSMSPSNSHGQNFRKQSEEVAMSPNNGGQNARADEKARDKDNRWAWQRRKTPHAQRFASFHVQYWSSGNNILCFDTTQYCRMTHCSMTPHRPRFLWDRITST